MTTYLADKAEDLSVEGPSARFTYRRMGPRGGVPLVLVHRFRGTIDWWDPEFLDLPVGRSRRHRVRQRRHRLHHR